MKSIFEYTDYRSFLGDMLAEKKQENPNFSFRFIARNLGLRSSAYFNLVLKGERRLSEALGRKVALLFRLSGREQEYFMHMLNYTDARNQTEKQFHFERMAAFHDRTANQVDSGRYRIYRKWYYSVLLEYLQSERTEDELYAAGKKLLPPISSRDVAEAITVLKDTGCIHQTPNGTYLQVQPVLTSGNEWQSEIIHNWQRSVFEMGRSALDAIPKEQRDMSSILVSVSQCTFDMMREEIRTLRRKFLTMAQHDSSPDKVYLCNIQLFPVTQKLTEEIP